MIQGHKPSGYVQTGTAEGGRVERETRQCCHCQHTWLYVPGSGDRRGYCLKHNGFLCGLDQCMREQLAMLAHYERESGRIKPECISFDDYNEFLLNTLVRKGQDWTRTSTGLLVPTEIFE